MIFKAPTDFFSDHEYVIRDSAYTPTPFLVLAYKKFGGQVVLFEGQVFFNDLLSSLCTNIGHTIGIWKDRVPFFISIRVNIASKKDMRHLIRLVKASAVLRNLFVGSHPVPESWLAMDDLISFDFDDELKSDEFLSSDLIGHP